MALPISNLVIATPNPEEFVCGYLGRLTLLNGARSSYELLTMLQLHHGIDGKRHPPVLALATANGIDLSTFVERHSLFDLHRAVVDDKVTQRHRDLLNQDILNKFGTRIFRRDARYCPVCAEHESQTAGVSFWHRDHQMPGSLICNEHHVELLRGERGSKQYLRPPLTQHGSAAVLSQRDLADLTSSTILRRYCQILLGFIEQGQSLSETVARSRIRDLSKRWGFCMGGQFQPRHLFHFVMESFPAAWLRQEFPTLPSRGPVFHFGPIDCITISRGPVQIYAMVLAIFFESVTEALDFWLNGTNNQQLSRAA